jgi:hypothetical protein
MISARASQIFVYFDEVQGRSEAQSKAYLAYAARALEFQTQKFAK